MSLKPFVPSEFYHVLTDPKLIINGEKASYVSIKPAGLKRAAEYYEHKHGTNISFPGIGDEHDDIMRFARFVSLRLPPPDKRRNPNTTYREAFSILGGTHATTVVYIKEKGEEALLISDSLGSSGYAAIINQMRTTIDIPIYIVRDKRQIDEYSCRTDSVLFGRDATALNKEKKGYRIPNLLKIIKQNVIPPGEEKANPSLFQRFKQWASKSARNYQEIKLPAELSKTTQVKTVSASKKDQAKIVHWRTLKDSKENQTETLPQFQSRYTDKNVTLVDTDDKGVEHKEENKDILNYLRIKGFKLANIIEIQFYLNQLKDVFADKWTNELQKKYIDKAKEILKSPDKTHEKLYAFTEQFILQNRKLPEKKSDAGITPKLGLS